MRPLLAAAACLFVLLSGCLGSTETTTTLPPPTTEPPVEAMTFATHVLPAIHKGHGLYEPTIDVSPSGVLYVSAHSTGVDVQGAPAYYSKDDGATWMQLPLAASAALPPSQQGGTPPPSDEIFIVAGDDGTAWGVDITLATYPVYGWCGDGAENCYANPNAYNRADTANECSAASLNDRPWAAHSNGTLLMVNNPGGGPVQVAALKAPPSDPVGVANPVTGPTWNMCAGDGAQNGGFIPGIPDIRPDGFFAVPQVQGEKLVVVTGNAADVMAVEQFDVFKHKNAPASAVGDFGQAAFDAEGTLFVAAMNNANSDPKSGGFQVAVSQSDGRNFTTERIATDGPVSSVYIDGNRWGEGALVNWGVVGSAGTDWFFGHLFVEDGKPVLRNVFLAVDDGPAASRHVQGAAVGPDGRAYMVMSEVSGNDDAEMAMAIGTTPLSVVVQDAGVRMPAEAAAPEAPEAAEAA